VRLYYLIEGLPNIGSSVKTEVYRAGPIHEYGVFMNFGSEAAAKHAATGQERELHRGILSLNKVAILKDSKAAHNVNPDRLAEDLVGGGSLPAIFINHVRQIKDHQGVNAAFDLIRRALEHRGFDGIAYININEDPGSVSYMIWDPSKFRHV